jgi:hypothetical protein
MRKFFSNPYAHFALFFVLGTGVTFFSGLYTGFHVQSNDFWSSAFYGRNMSWSDMESLYNGYYPFGYALLIGLLPYTYVAQLAYIINALLAGLFTASVSSLISVRRFLPATLLAVALSISHRLIFLYANNPGPDMGSAAFPAFAAYLLWKDAFAEENKSQSNILPILIGATLGLGFLWRTHAIVLAILILIFAVIFRILPSWSAYVKMIAAFLVLVSMQVCVDLISGHQAFETAQTFNVYKFLYGINWTRTPTPQEIEQFSIIGLLLDKPLFVLNAMLPYLKYLLSFALPGVACFLIAPKGAVKNFALFSALCIAIYAVPLSLGDSPRAPLPILGLYLMSLAALFMVLTERLTRLTPPARWMRYAVTLAVLLLFVPAIYGWINVDWAFIAKNKNSHRAFSAIERVLLARGMKSPNEVFSNKYQLYLPNRPPYLPRQIAPWSSDWFWGFAEQYPPLPNDSWESFRSACVRQGIKFLALSPSAAAQGDFFSAIYERKADNAEMGIKFLAEQVNMRIYELVP